MLLAVNTVRRQGRMVEHVDEVHQRGLTLVGRLEQERACEGART
jgi:hypothetical protein